MCRPGCDGLRRSQASYGTLSLLLLINPLVVVRQVDIQDVAVLNTEHNPPQARYPHRLLAFGGALQRTQPVERFGLFTERIRSVEGQKDVSYAVDVRRVQLARVAAHEEPPQAAVPDTAYRHLDQCIA